MKLFLCASKYNYHKIPPIAKQLRKMGHILTMPNKYRDPFLEERVKAESKEKHIQVKRKFLKLQVKKVLRNDAVLILNFEKNGQMNYLGGSTFLEMYEAFKAKKKLFLYNPIPEGMLRDEITAFNPLVINGNLDLVK